MGAITVAVHPDTGTTWHARQFFEDILLHPENGLPLINRTVPDWRRIIAIAKRAAAALEMSRLTIRIVVDKYLGPMVLDIRARPNAVD